MLNLSEMIVMIFPNASRNSSVELKIVPISVRMGISWSARVVIACSVCVHPEVVTTKYAGTAGDCQIKLQRDPGE
jgi:hypothetical protein